MRTEARAMLDPRLNQTGRDQAQALRERLKIEAPAGGYDLVVVSPLSRAIETAHIVFRGLSARFIITPEQTETAKLELGSAQLGRSLPELTADFPFLSEWDCSMLQPERNWKSGGAGWMHPLVAEERVSHFKTWLHWLKEEKVVVVGHSGVLDPICGKKIGNCELTQHQFSH